MKKQSGSRVGKVIKGIFNVRGWSDYDRMKSFTGYLSNGIRKMFIPQQNAKGSEASFDTTIAALNLTEKELISRQKGLYRVSLLMCLLAIGFLGYSLYHFWHESFRAAIVSLVLTLLALVLAFRYHFWYFQIKERKLGCSFKEWYRQGLLGEKK